MRLSNRICRIFKWRTTARKMDGGKYAFCCTRRSCFKNILLYSSSCWPDCWLTTAADQRKGKKILIDSFQFLCFFIFIPRLTSLREMNPVQCNRHWTSLEVKCQQECGAIYPIYKAAGRNSSAGLSVFFSLISFFCCTANVHYLVFCCWSHFCHLLSG